MPKLLIVYHSRTGNTEKMAGFIKEGAASEGVEAEARKADEVKAEELLDYEGIIIGSPTYYGAMAWEVKKLLDDSVKFHGRLEGKIAGAFSSSANLGGGNETAVISILQAMLIHGMVVQGSSSGAHYGPVSVGPPDEKAKSSCMEFGIKYARLAKKLAP
jgi:NAD(P)H dehydrogenase (quinone)